MTENRDLNIVKLFLLELTNLYNESPILKNSFKDENSFKNFLTKFAETIIHELKLDADANRLVSEVMERYRQIHEKFLYSSDRDLDPLIKKIEEVFEHVMESYGLRRGIISNVLITILARVERILSLSR